VSTKIKMISLALILFSLMVVVKAEYTIGVSEDRNLGRYLTDEHGMTLYYFRGDNQGTSNCYGDCPKNWPPFYTENIDTPKEINDYDFTTITREDGKLQTTYKGRPLYLHKDDFRAGDITGQGISNMWFIVEP
jgi:predicted lipoprotein with Yx(FWY)xxD motif